MWWVSVALAQTLAPGVELAVVQHEGHSFRVVTVDLRQADLILTREHSVGELEQARTGWLAATNAGLYHTPERPVGLFVVDGVEHAPLERGKGEGNFYLLPNGVFSLDDAGARVVETREYKPQGKTRLATQSGPALVLEGALHPSLLRESRSTNVRNAVGVSDPHTVHLVLTLEPVNLWTLASVMRDALRCTDALYLDGSISGMWGPSLPPSTKSNIYAGFLVVQPKDR